MSDSQGKSLSDLPVELLLDHLLPSLDVKALLALSATNRTFAELCNDETFWKLKCKQDFNFSGSRTARSKGWRFIYKGLTNPKVFVWGGYGNGRMGRRDIPRTSVRGVPYPLQVPFPKKSAIVDIIAGGWSFHALDSWGNVFVWGTLDGEIGALVSDGYSFAGQVAETPLQLQLPEPIRTLSCGRKHSTAFDSKGQIWNFNSWGRPFKLVSPALDSSSPASTPTQVECGWTFSAALTESGDIYAWWPFDHDIQTSVGATMAAMDEQGGQRADATADGKIPCATWDLIYNPECLPRIDVRRLPKLHEDQEEDIKVAKIAAADNCILALTNGGHVLKLDSLNNPASARSSQWEYLPKFSEANEIRNHPAFATAESSEGEASHSGQELGPPKDVRINNITAHFRHFVAYTSEEESIVLRGDVDTEPSDQPSIIPELQYKSIITVALGDYHNAALTSDGRLYTWGGYSNGALGLGDPSELPVGAPGGVANERQLNAVRDGYGVTIQPVETPSEVRFDHGLRKRKESFCFAATAAGWHTGALVIDLDPEDDDDKGAEAEDEPTQRMPGHFDANPSHPPGGGAQAPFIPLIGQFGHRGALPFRVGHAGRMARGGMSRGLFLANARGRGGGGPNPPGPAGGSGTSS